MTTIFLRPATRRRIVAQMREAHGHAIEINPKALTFTRTVYADNAQSEADRTVVQIGPVVCRLYQDRYARETVTATLGAPVQVGQRWGLLVPWNWILVGDPDAGDEFTVDEGYFRVREIFRHAVGPQVAQVWGYECDVVRLA